MRFSGRRSARTGIDPSGTDITRTGRRAELDGICDQFEAKRWAGRTLSMTEVLAGVAEELKSELEVEITAVAGKMLRDGLADDPRAVDRFRQEAAVLRSLRLPGVGGIADLFIVCRTLFLIMER